MRRRVMAGLLIALFALSLGCARTITVSGVPVHERVWNQTVQELGARASYDLRCPAPNLQFTLFRMIGRQPVEVGVDGCGQRAMYIRPNLSTGGGRRWGGRGRTAVSGSWVLSNTGQAAAPQVPQGYGGATGY